MHHARDAAGPEQLQQQPAHRADSGARHDPLRDDSRDADRWLDGRPHLSPDIRLWNGDSRGRWEGDTLVIETKNFNEQQEFAGTSMGTATLIERFTRIGPDEIDYRFTIDDPVTYTRPVTVIEPMIRNHRTVLSYACHEFNYGLRNILSGAEPRSERARD